VVSKYIGETAKHLSEIFRRAERMSAVLLFDEADALFAKRTEVKDAHDRHANTDTSYLLQLLEEFRGIAFLTTNRKGNMDPAFVRRIRYIFDFPAPEARERRRIWGNVLTALADAETEASLRPTLDRLAGGTAVSGAQIKNAVLASVFIARRRGEPLSGAHLLAGLHRELSKEGRSVSPRERARIENGS
jgi:SpoVK/Ycf46/Vps4 family AAA+-type ATPase